MKTYILKLKKNNKGMSLIEILVTLAIISIVATPLINSFITAMKTDAEARIIQNGTSTAQYVAELFKVFDIEDMVESYNDEGVEVDVDEDGVYTFTGIKIEGANGEDFVLDVTLNPIPYSGGGNTGKTQVNNKQLPVFSGLHDSESIIIQKEYTRYDDQLQELFAGSNLPKNIIENIYQEEHKKNITKNTVINVKCKYDKGQYDYVVNMYMTYTYEGNGYKESVYGSSIVEKLYEEGELQSIYMICPIFDKYSTTIWGEKCNYATDTIDVTFVYDGDEEKQQELYFYIAEQEEKHIENGSATSYFQKINPDNLKVKSNLYQTGASYPEYYSDLVNAMAKPKFNLFTNIGDFDVRYDKLSDDNKHDLTEGDYDTGAALYQMDIVVKLEGRTGTIATFSTTR